jgi:hypothetical protein
VEVASAQVDTPRLDPGLKPTYIHACEWLSVWVCLHAGGVGGRAVLVSTITALTKPAEPQQQRSKHVEAGGVATKGGDGQRAIETSSTSTGYEGSHQRRAAAYQVHHTCV